MKNYMLCLAACFILLTACQPAIDYHGNIEAEENFSSFAIGKTTESDVINKCGTPSLRSDKYTLIYTGFKAEEESFKEVKVINLYSIVMTFNEDKILKSIEKVYPKNDRLIFDDDMNRLIGHK